MRKRKLFAIAMSVMCTAALMTGCGSSNGASSSDAGSGADTGSTSQLISVVSREDGSGTRGAFVELTGVEERMRMAIRQTIQQQMRSSLTVQRS